MDTRSGDAFGNPVARHVWDVKYRYREGGRVVDRDLDDTWWRVAHALAAVEGDAREAWARRFHDAMIGFAFIPGGRILAGAGTRHRVTLFNCFVMGTVPDSLDAIFRVLHESALTLQQGGGIGCDFSALRPAGQLAWSSGNSASGPVSFMRIWDAAAGTIQSQGSRRSAMLASLRCDHPDIFEFIAAKQDGGLENFNLSVQCTDEFMRALAQDAEWPLVFPADAWRPDGDAAASVQRRWPGRDGLVKCRLVRVVRARELWNALATAAAGCGDPGVLFVDRINQENNLWYEEYLTVANPCGEVPLPAYGACDLGSLNLAALVLRPFTADAHFDFTRFRELVPVAVRMLDDAIDASQFPLPAQAERVHRSRRLGLGVTGFADALIMLGLHYDSAPARGFAAELFRTLRDEAYRASVALAQERGAFPAYDPDYLSAAFIRRLPDDISSAITAHGIRNSHLLAVAPAGTISLLAGNVSSGIEPVYDFHVERDIRGTDGRPQSYPLTDHAWQLWHSVHGAAPLPHQFVTASALSPSAQLAMLATIAPFVDNAISKTVALPLAADAGQVAAAFTQAYRLGLKGCMVFAEDGRRGVMRSGAAWRRAS